MKKTIISKAFKATIPVFTGYVILGIGFGLSMKNNGYSLLMIFIMALCIYAGSLQYVGINLLNGPATVINTLITSFAVNARHLFYGISMIDRYKDFHKHKNYIIFALTDETYSLLCDGELPEPSEEYCFYVSLFDHMYWISGCVLGGLIGEFIPFKIVGIEFSMTALFIATLVSQWKASSNHINSITGLLCSVLCLILFGRDNFLIPAMILIITVLTVLRNRLEGDHDDR